MNIQFSETVLLYLYLSKTPFCLNVCSFFLPLYVSAERYLTMQKNELAISNSVSAIKSKTRINVNSHCQVSECYVAREGRLCCQCFGRFQAEFLCLCKTVVFVWHFQWRWECCVASLIASMQWKSDL